MPVIDTTALVPDFYDPPHLLINPHAKHAEDLAVDWLRRIGLVTTEAQENHLRSFEFGLYHGMATPNANLSGLVLGLKWFCWGSLADDQYDNYDGRDHGPRLMSVLRAMRAVVHDVSPPEGTRNPVVAGFVEYWPELTAGLTARRRCRTAEHFLDYMEAVAYQNTFHSTGSVPDMATFLTLRRNTIAMVFQVDVLEIVSKLDVPDALRDSYLFRELVNCFADIAAWHNDVYGLEKDLEDGQTCNAVRVVAQEEKCSLSNAVERVLTRAENRQQTFLTIESQLPGLAMDHGLPESAAGQALRLAADLRAYLYANLVWSQKTRRYDLEVARIRGSFDDVIGAPAPETLANRRHDEGTP